MSPKMARFIRGKVKRGGYTNASEVVRDAVRRIRARKAMLIEPGDPDCRSAGSFFKNPIVTEDVFARIEASAGDPPPRYPASDGKVKTAAAWLIERAGISKGFSIGPAGVSTKHTLALINKGGAGASDVIKLAREIRGRVESRFGILFEPEEYTEFADVGEMIDCIYEKLVRNSPDESIRSKAALGS